MDFVGLDIDIIFKKLLIFFKFYNIQVTIKELIVYKCD